MKNTDVLPAYGKTLFQEYLLRFLQNFWTSVSELLPEEWLCHNDPPSRHSPCLILVQPSPDLRWLPAYSYRTQPMQVHRRNNQGHGYWLRSTVVPLLRASLQHKCTGNTAESLQKQRLAVFLLWEDPSWQTSVLRNPLPSFGLLRHQSGKSHNSLRTICCRVRSTVDTDKTAFLLQRIF